jgi:hypothetical protein
MKFMMAALARDKDGQHYRSMIGMYKGPEDYHVIQHTCAPIINAGIQMMLDHNALIIEWADGFDFLLVPAVWRERITVGRGEDGLYWASWQGLVGKRQSKVDAQRERKLGRSAADEGGRQQESLLAGEDGRETREKSP